MKSVDYREKSETRTSRVGRMVQDGTMSSSLAKASITGTYYKYENVTTTTVRNFLILHPSEEEINLSNIPGISYFVNDLNKLLKQI